MVNLKLRLKLKLHIGGDEIDSKWKFATRLPMHLYYACMGTERYILRGR